MPHTISLRGKWLVNAPVDAVYRIVTDFERMPERFPRVAERLTVVGRDGNRLKIDAVARTFGRSIGVKMDTLLLPGEGYVSDNVSEMGTSGHEEFRLRTHPEGTLIDYRYDVRLNTWFWVVFAKPLIGWYAMRFWKRHFIGRLREIVE